MNIGNRLPMGSICGAGLFLLLTLGAASAADNSATTTKSKSARESDKKSPKEDRLKLTGEQRAHLDEVVDKALAFLAKSQKSDGSFPTQRGAEPAVTSLCVMAFLSRGHLPGTQPYGPCIDRGVDYVLKLQDEPSGALIPLGSKQDFYGNYNHAICALMLCDAYSKMGARAYRDVEENQRRHDRIEIAIQKALVYSRNDQTRPKQQSGARGGWRYLKTFVPNESDLSVTAWMVMFYGSARKAGFAVPKKGMENAMTFVRRTFDKRRQGFVYALSGDERYCSRATVGAGIICLTLGGDAANSNIPIAASWIHKHAFEPYNRSQHPEDRYHYSAFYCSQAMALLGGYDFARFYPKLLMILSQHQHDDGSWEPESIPGDTMYGNVYTTALSVLALSPPYQKLDTYRRGR